jgi:hypothetical protein
MTNLEALKSRIAGYPLEENTYLASLLDRSIVPEDNYTGKTEAFELATADVYIVLATGVNVTEGGYQLSLTDKSNFLKVAGKIYEKYGELNPLADKVPTIEDATNLW